MVSSSTKLISGDSSTLVVEFFPSFAALLQSKTRTSFSFCLSVLDISVHSLGSLLVLGKRLTAALLVGIGEYSTRSSLSP